MLFPVLVSSVFLQIEKLINECLNLWKRNFTTIMMKERIPVSQLQSGIFSRLCSAITAEKLLRLEREC